MRTDVKLLRVMLDSNVFDVLADDTDLVRACVGAIVSDSLLLVVTHVQADELAAIPDSNASYRAYLIDHLEHLAAPINTSGAVLDVSRLDRSTLFSEEDAARHKAFVGGDHRRAKDALILATADREHIPVVTMESKGRKLRRVADFFPDVELWSIGTFREAVASLPQGELEWSDEPE